MADVFVSYARADEPQAERVAEALRADGYRAWRDDELPAHRAYAEVIEERLKSAKAVVVLWSAEAAKSQWVRAEADAARELGTLIQATLDGGIPPMPFNQIQCAALSDWDGERDAPGWRKLRRQRPGARRGAAGRQAGRPPKPAAALGLRPALRQHERRSRAGIFQRRDQRGHHHRSVEGLGARRGRPQHRLHLQGPVGQRPRDLSRSSASATSSKAACARPAGGCASTPS